MRSELDGLRFRLYWLPEKDLWPPRSPFRGLKSLFSSLVAVAALCELAYLAFGRHGRFWLLGAAVIGPSLIYMVTHVDPRYRYPTFGLCTLMGIDFLGSLLLLIAKRVSGWILLSRPEGRTNKRA